MSRAGTPAAGGADRSPEVVTLGETMVLMSALSSGRLRHVDTFRRSIGGAEATFAIALSRLSIETGWVSRLGDDEFGAYIAAFLRGEGVDVSRVALDATRPTGVFFKEQQRQPSSSVVYYRSGTAASALHADDLDPAYLKSARYLHLTGITLALSDSARGAFDIAIEYARSAGVRISLDANVRWTLWPGERWSAELGNRVAAVDTLLLTLREAELLTGESDPHVAVKTLLRQGPATVAVKDGAEGAWIGSADGIFHQPATPLHPTVQTHGAGDAFAAGLVAGELWGWSLQDAARLASLLGACATTVSGNVEGLPVKAEAVAALEGTAIASR